jgi:hypothetical protein
MQYKLLGSPGHPYCHLELIPCVRKSQLNVGGLFALLEGNLYWILLGNVANRRILSTDSSLTLYPLKPFKNAFAEDMAQRFSPSLVPKKILLKELLGGFRKKSFTRWCMMNGVLCEVLICFLDRLLVAGEP